MKNLAFLVIAFSLLIFSSCNSVSTNKSEQNKNCKKIEYTIYNTGNTISDMSFFGTGAYLSIVHEDSLYYRFFNTEINEWETYKESFTFNNDIENICSIKMLKYLFTSKDEDDFVSIFKKDENNDSKLKFLSQQQLPNNSNIFNIGNDFIGLVYKNFISVINMDSDNQNIFQIDKENPFVIPEGATGLIGFGYSDIGIIKENKLTFYHYDENSKQVVPMTDNSFVLPNKYDNIISMLVLKRDGDLWPVFGIVNNRKIDFYQLDDEGNWIEYEEMNFNFE